MSLYSREEICAGCNKAIFHSCCGSFCKCEDGHEDTVNGYNCTCEFKDTTKNKADICPECGADLIIKNSGVKCSACDYWFCY